MVRPPLSPTEIFITVRANLYKPKCVLVTEAKLHTSFKTAMKKVLGTNKILTTGRSKTKMMLLTKESKLKKMNR